MPEIAPPARKSTGSRRNTLPTASGISALDIAATVPVVISVKRRP